MRKILASLLLIVSLKAVSFGAYSDEGLLNQSSFTMSNETLVAISSTAMAGNILVGVVIGSSTPGGTISLFDSVGVKVSTIGILSMAGSSNGAMYVPFEVRLSSGLTYSTVSNTNGVTIIYKNVRPH